MAIPGLLMAKVIGLNVLFLKLCSFLARLVDPSFCFSFGLVIDSHTLLRLFMNIIRDEGIKFLLM